MTDEEKKEIIAALKAESTDVTSLEVVSSLDGVTSLPAVQGNKLVRAPIPLLAKPATDAAETANAAAETANAAAERAESAAEIAETYIKTTDDEDKYVRGTLNMTDGTISESTQTGTIVCQQYIGIPEGTEQISVWLYSVTTLSGNAAVTFYDGQHNFLSANAVTANNVNAFELPNGARYLRYQMPAENVIEIRIAADGWTLAESFNPAKIKEDIPNQIRTGYSDDGVSIDILHGEALLWSDTIEPATEERAGVMSAEDKRHLDAALYEVDDTAYFPDYVETQIRGYDGDGHSIVINAATQSKAGVMSAEDKRHLDAALYQVDDTAYFPDYVETQIRGYDGDGHSVTVKAATKTEAGVMSSTDKTALDALALYNAKSVITVAGMDFTHGDILEILKGHRPTRYAVKYETEASSYVCGILDAYTSRDGRVFTEIYTGGCDLAKDFTGGTHDSGRIYQFMRQYCIFGSGTPAAGTWSAWQSCLSSAAMEELSAMGLDYEVFEGETDGYIEVKLTGKDGGVVGGSTEIPFASAAKSGFMSKEDKVTLDSFDGKIKGEQTAREEADSALGGRIAALEKKVPNEIRTGYSDDGVSIDILHGEALLWSDTIEPATEERAGVMSAADKIEQRNIRTLVETFKKNLIPSGLTVSCLERITLGNVEPIYITAELTPDTAYRNIIYISDNKAVTVGTDSRVTPVSVGKSVVSVIPTCNTSLAKTIIVEVGRPFTRLVNNRSTLRFTSSGTFRLT